MNTFILFIASVVGQLPAEATIETTRTVAVVIRADGSAVASDVSGKAWSSPDPEWLGRFIAMKNAEIREAAKADAAKAAEAARNHGETHRPPSNPPTPRTPLNLPTGVKSSMWPHIPPGSHWYGGNVPPAPVGAKKSGDAIGATEDTGPSVHLTIIGPETERSAVLERLKADPSVAKLVESMGDRLAIQDYDPSDPMVADVGLPAGGKPDVVIQSADGKVRYRSKGDPGPAVIAAELRRADPRYDPANDPDGKSNLLGFFSNQEEMLAALAAAGVLLFAIAWKPS